MRRKKGSQVPSRQVRNLLHGDMTNTWIEEELGTRNGSGQGLTRLDRNDGVGLSVHDQNGHGQGLEGVRRSGGSGPLAAHQQGAMAGGKRQVDIAIDQGRRNQSPIDIGFF